MTATIKQTLAAPQWQKVGIRPHHGIDIPLSAIHTQNSCGIGEFLDLLPLIDWCSSVGFDVVQLLPLNDSAQDPSPYNALSSIALNPIFISLTSLPHLEKHPDLLEKIPELKKLTKSHRVAYHNVLSHKLMFLRIYFERAGRPILRSRAFRNFMKENPWLKSYGLYKCLRASLEFTGWSTWPSDIVSPSPQDLSSLMKHYSKEVTFYTFLQFLAFKQMRSVKKYARKKKVKIKGDIPILISPDSVDTWDNPTLFDFTHAAGAPPDQYSASGQYWGFPLYRWDDMEKRDFVWWKRRLKYAENFYDIYRIDHAIGFFRIWGIPLGKDAPNGEFIPKDPSEWIPQGKKLLSLLLEYGDMLPIAEDLGAVFDEQRVVLKDLGICGTRVLQWEIEEHNDYPTLSLSTVSTHDSPTIEQWWTSQQSSAKAFAKKRGWDYSPILTRETRRAILHTAHHTTSLFHINLLGEYLALFPELVWQNPEDERINTPGTLSDKNWTYRIRPSLEQIADHEELKEEISLILKKKSM